MVKYKDRERGKKLYGVREGEVYHGTVVGSASTSQFGELTTLGHIESDVNIPESVSMNFKQHEIFVEIEVACIIAVSQCDTVIEKLEDKKAEVVKELREGRKRREKIGKKLLEIRNELKKELHILKI